MEKRHARPDRPIATHHRKKPRTYWCVFDFPTKETQLQELQKKSEEPDLWNDPEQAQEVMKKLSALREEVEDWRAAAACG